MSKPPVHGIACSVVGADKLPAEIGGADSVCRIIRAAAEPAAAERGQAATIMVEVVAPSAAVAKVTMADGRSLAPARIDVSDRSLNGRAIEMLAKAAADQIRAGSIKK